VGGGGGRGKLVGGEGKKEKDNAETQSAQRKRRGTKRDCLGLRFSCAGWQPARPGRFGVRGDDGLVARGDEVNEFDQT
jgi:hypothetical protein